MAAFLGSTGPYLGSMNVYTSQNICFSENRIPTGNVTSAVFHGCAVVASGTGAELASGHMPVMLSGQDELVYQSHLGIRRRTPRPDIFFLPAGCSRTLQSKVYVFSVFSFQVHRLRSKSLPHILHRLRCSCSGAHS